MTPSILSIVYFVYALALAGGGFMGYKTAGSIPSLVGSGIFAVLAIIVGILLSQKQLHNGLMFGIETTMLVIGLFLFRFLLTGKMMPAGPAIGMSIIVLVLTLMVLSANKSSLQSESKTTATVPAAS